MDTSQPLEDQFSKLHPCFPVKTRIGILGAGPSGVSAAYALTRLGYSNVTVLEKHHSVGGMCESVDIEGKIYDLGGQVLAKNSAPVIFQLAKEAEMELEEMDSHKLALIDSSTGKFDDAKVADDYVSVIPLTLELQDKAKNSGCIGVHAVSDSAADLTLDYLGSRGLKGIPKSVAYGYTASGYGFPQDMAYAYVHEFTRTSMAGKIRRFKGGYTGLWEKVIKSIPVKLHRGTEVLSVKRNPETVQVKIKNPEGNVESMEFDKIIISGSFPFKNGKTYRSPIEHSTEFEANEAMDLCETERELFGKVQAIDYYTTVLKINGLEDFPVGFYYFNEYMEDPATIGHPVAMQKFYSDTDIFLFWSYGNSADVTGPTVTDLAIKVVKNWGVEVKEVLLQRRFRYFPHVTSQDMKDGFYERVESELQGLRNTYYVGGLMAFELTERNSSYSMALVAKHFANDNPLPMFPYVKALLPLQSDFWQHKHKELGELPGVEFPDLSTLVGYLKHWGLHQATKDTKLYTWLNEDGAIVSQRTYSELLANASCIAHKLLASQKPVIKPGDRVLLVHVPGLDFVDAFFGCLIARVLPVPVLPPDPMQRGGQALLKIENVAKSSNAVAILSTLRYHSAVRAGLVKNLIQLTGKKKSTAKWPNLPWIHTDSWIKSSKNSPLVENADLEFESQPDDLCFLQFTSGSTGDAKGVMITHGGLIHNVKLMKKRYKSTSKTVLVSWLPQYHDMGLIGGLFTALVSGGTAVLFSPLTFIKSPLLWLQVMSDYKATHSAGPNFAFELMVRRLESEKEKNRTFDLSSVIFLMVAAEPVRHKTLRKFLDLTRPFGLSQEVMAPGYGLAENCVFVSCAYGEGKPVLVDWQGRVCCGYAYSDNENVDLKIVEPESGEELGEGNEGEIWISSPSAGVGYWGKDEQTRNTFGNVLQGRKYTRTGDLGRIIKGNIFITGRIKDLIIVAGRNIYSADVEKTVENASDSIRPGCCAVVGVPEEVLLSKGISVPDGSDQVGLVVIAEVRDGKLVDDDVVETIKTRVSEEHGVSVACVKLIKPRTISKTTSGKIKRFECLKSFADGTLNTLPDPILSKRRLIRSFTTGTCKEGSTPRPNLVSSPIHKSKFGKKDIEEFLLKLVSEQTGIPVHKISTTENLVSYGIDSIGVVKAAQKLSDFLGVPVGAVDIFTATCIEELASFSESLVKKSQPEMANTSSESPEPDIEFSEFLEPSMAQQVQTWVLQVFAFAYICFILSFPAYFSVSAFTSFTSMGQNHWFGFLRSLALAPLAWIFCMACTCFSIAFLGNSFLKPNYALTPEVSVWSVDFVKWWALYKAQEMSSKVFAHHLRGTVFLNYWFGLLGAKIGPSVLLDTVDITDPSLVSIADGAVIAEGALIQGHEVKNETLSFNPIKIGKNSSVGPYSVIQKGTVLRENANVPPLQKSEGPKVSANAQNTQKGHTDESFHHFMGIYLVGFLSSLSAAFVYLLFTWVSQKPVSLQHFSFLCICGAFHWIPFTIIAYITMVGNLETNPVNFATSFALAYVAHGLILSLLTSTLNHFLSENHQWLRNRINTSCHLRFAKLLSGTEAFCIYLRLLGAKVGKHCSIRAINPVSDPKLIKIGNGVHLGDFSRVIPKFYSSNGPIQGKIEVNDNAVVGSQSLVLPGSIVQNSVILGALSVSPVNSVLHQGGVYVGSQNPKMIKNTMHSLDDRIEEMDAKYKKIVGNLAANLAATTLKVKSRYFHRIGVSAKGYLKIYDSIKGFPEHKIFGAGTRYPVIVRHSNSLSADDDARIDARGASIRILSNEKDFGSSSSIVDLTLKTGNAFYARTIADFASWLVCGLPAREAFVKRVPHVRDAVWNSLRNANSYAELHYYSNYSRLLRFGNGKEMYVRFKLRPFDQNVSEDSGKVEPIGILPPETGAIPRDKNDTRPLLFLAEDFKNRVSSGGARYIFQVQIRDVPGDEENRDIALDVTKPWDEKDFPFIDIGEIFLDQNLTSQESERLEFNPFIRCPEIDMIRARLSSESASIDHGRSIIYEICQHLRNGDPLPEAWRVFIEQSDVKVDLSGCPMAATLAKKDSGELTLSQTWYQTSWSIFGQPLLQTVVPFFLLGLAIFGPLQWVIFLKESSELSVHWLISICWVISGALAALICVFAKWVLVGKRREGEKLPIWSKRVFMDTVWQAIRTVVGDFFLEMTSGSILYNLVLKMMGSGVGFGAYVDSMEAGLNPEMVEIERGGSVGKGAILFGHIYEGEGGKVKFGKVRVAEGGFVGSRAVAMPGVQVESGGSLSALSLAMKGETVRSK